jgi:hypothetical protein
MRKNKKGGFDNAPLLKLLDAGLLECKAKLTCESTD